MTKRRVQGGEATSERRRRDGVYQKSFKRIFHPLKNLLPRARVSRASRAWRVRAARGKAQVGGFTAPHNLNYTTRANISHEIAEQIRARIVRTPAEKRLGGRESNMCVDGMKVPFFILSIGCTWTLSCRGEHRSPAIIHKDTFSFLVLLYDQEEGSGWRSHL